MIRRDQGNNIPLEIGNPCLSYSLISAFLSKINRFILDLCVASRTVGKKKVGT